MFKVAETRHRHSDATLVAHIYTLLITDTATRLDNGGNALIGS